MSESRALLDELERCDGVDMTHNRDGELETVEERERRALATDIQKRGGFAVEGAGGGEQDAEFTAAMVHAKNKKKAK